MQKRIIVSILLSIFVILAGLGLISHLPAVRERVPRYLEVRRAGRDGTTGSTVVVRDN